METLESKPRIEIMGQEGIVLKQLVSEDAENYFNLIQYDPDHLRQFDDDTADKYPSVGSVVDSIITPEDPNKLRLGIWHDDTMVGTINLKPTGVASGIVGYWVGKEYIGNEYAAKAVRALTDYAFESAGLQSLLATVHIGNYASRKTLQKTGFRLQATEPKFENKWQFELTKPRDINPLAL